MDYIDVKETIVKKTSLFCMLTVIFFGCASGPRSEKITASDAGIIQDNYIYELTLFETHKIKFEIHLENIDYSETTASLIKRLIYQGKNPDEYADYLEKQFVDDYTADDIEILFNYESCLIVNYAIDFHDDDFIIIHYNDYIYSGGAHGNYKTLYYIIDIASERILNISDLITPVSDAVLTELIRKEYDFEYFLRDNIWQPDSINISSNGISLLWNIYSITPYVAGLININLPNANLYLTEKGMEILAKM